MGRFDPERMAVYRLARQHNRAVRRLLEAADHRGHAELAAQLRHSAASIPANILEAFGEWRSGRRLHYLRIAKGSTWESWAHIDTLVDFGLATAEQAEEARALQNQITALLLTTIRGLEASPDPPENSKFSAGVPIIPGAECSNTNTNTNTNSKFR